MDHIQRMIETEIIIQSQLLKQSRAFLQQAPEGHLFARQRKRQVSYYQTIRTKTEYGWQTTHINITSNQAIIQALTEKMYALETQKICINNLKQMKQLLSKYKPYNRDDLAASLPPKYLEALRLCKEEKIRNWLHAPYDKAPFNPQSHVHETAYGELVRSKSEVIIANALYGYGVPFHYEEKFTYPNDNGDFYYPDFTILLPNGSKLIWEHLGLLSEMGYCISNAQKLHTYQHNNVVIGKNLILTQDDSQGNCSSATTYRIIEENILPLFDGIKLNPALLRNSANLHQQ